VINFLHVPKAAGSAVQNIFKQQYTPEDIFFVKGAQPDKSIQKILESEIKPEIIFGHFDFGTFEKLGSKIKYISIIRHPAERIISHYYYVKSQPNHYLFQTVTENNLSLRDYLEAGLTNELNNGQTRMLAGAGGYHKNLYSKFNIPYGQCKKELLILALENVENHFVSVGFQEDFYNSVFLIKKALRWEKSPHIKTVNKTQNKPAHLIPDKETIAAIENYNSLDLQLYEILKKDFRRLLKKHSFYLKKEHLRYRMLQNQKRIKNLVYRKLKK